MNDAVPQQPVFGGQDFASLRVQMAQAVKDQAEERFIELVNGVDWLARPVDDSLWAIDQALKVEAPLVARRLSQAGAQRFPDHAEILKAARVLAPVKTIRTDLPPDPGPSQNTAWLQANRASYQGRWVAIRAGALLASAASFDEIRQLIGNTKNTGILITRV